MGLNRWRSLDTMKIALIGDLYCWIDEPCGPHSTSLHLESSNGSLLEAADSWSNCRQIVYDGHQVVTEECPQPNKGEVETGLASRQEKNLLGLLGLPSSRPRLSNIAMLNIDKQMINMERNDDERLDVEGFGCAIVPWCTLYSDKAWQSHFQAASWFFNLATQRYSEMTAPSHRTTAPTGGKPKSAAAEDAGHVLRQSNTSSGSLVSMKVIIFGRVPVPEFGSI